ncbi:Coiled-coil domain-containing protein 177 [Takifugu flavidus]|uniref:Coiled-coil domain-containing protein 177 n=1 Tax=Takifugu flavidus TaxID=433684 RepID=A0A5C6PII1_9TELE|nr:Coiled-coil domain-containing protein 177 [Takifugu flavidus]
MGELNGTSSVLRWDLPPSEAEGSRPPRSVPTCARLGLRPVQLLIKSLNERLAERNVLPFESVRLMHESYEKERRRLLQTRQEETGRITEAAGDRLQCNDSQVSGPEVKDYKRDRRTTGPVQYADLCIKGGPASRSCSAADHPGRTRGCSFGLGDLKYPKAIEMKVERLTKDINEEMCVSLSERDRKIAALMLLKHQEEQDSLKHSQKQEQERQEAHRKEEAQRVEEDKERLKKLKKNMQRWQEELEARRRTRQQWEAETIGQRERRGAAAAGQMEESEGGEEHLREKEEVEKRRQDRERRAAVEREQKAWRSKRAQVEKKRRQLEERNHQEILRHVLLREQAERRAEEEAAHRRRELERKLRRSCEKHAEATEERHKEARSGRQQRTERAALLTFARTRDRAEQVKERNRRRQLCHGMLRERIRREEEEARQVRGALHRAKEWRRERLRRQREQLQEEARRLARASFHMRERVRQQTGRRSFHRMALEAQLSASLASMKL